MEDFNSETDSDYTSYWRDWVSATRFCSVQLCVFAFFFLRLAAYIPLISGIVIQQNQN